MALRHVLKKGVAAGLRAVLSNSFGFGGNGVVLAFEHASSGPADAVAHRRRSVLVSGARLWVDAPPATEEQPPTECSSVSGDPPSSIQARLSPRQALSALDADRSRRFDLFTALITKSAEETLRTCGRDRDSIGLVTGFCYGHVTRLSTFMERIALRGPRHAPPAEFPHLSPSSSSGNASVYLGLKGPAFVVADERLTGDAALDMAVCLIQSGSAEALVVAAASVADPGVCQALESLGLGAAEDCSRVAAGSLAVMSEQAAERWSVAPSAEIVATAVLRDISLASRILREPADSEASLLVDLAGPGVLSVALSGSAWLRVRRLEASPPGGAIEVIGMSALICALQLLHQGAAREILVCTQRAGCVSLVHLRAMPS
jgi:3-oxoacyl-[acyl-carrier-protein] synthase II